MSHDDTRQTDPQPAPSPDAPTQSPPADHALRREYLQEIEQHQRRIDSLQTLVCRLTAGGELRRELGRRGVERLDQAAELLARRVRVRLGDDDRTELQVLDESGEAAEGLGVGGLVENWLVENPHFLPPAPDTGSGVRKGQTSAHGVTVEQLDRNPAAKARFIATHGPAAFLRLARSRR